MPDFMNQEKLNRGEYEAAWRYKMSTHMYYFFLLTVLISCESVSFNVVHLDINVMYTAYHQQKQSRRSWLL